MKSVKKERLKALFKLIDDPDIVVYKAVEKELLNAKSSIIIPQLETLYETISDPVYQTRIERLIRKIRFKESFIQLRRWARQSSPDLLEGFILANRYHNPDLNEPKIHRKIEQIRKKVWIELNDSLTSLEKIAVLNHVLFNDFQITIAAHADTSPHPCFIHKVLETGQANQFSIALIYCIIAQKLEFPVRYIDLPRHPLLAYIDRKTAEKVHPPGTGSDILFYINPANNGSIAGRKELEYILKKLKYDIKEIRFEGSSPKVFLLRLMEMTRKIYSESGDPFRADDIALLMDALSDKKSSPSAPF